MGGVGRVGRAGVWYNTHMKIVPLILLVPMMAFGVTVEPLPQSEYADTEVSTNIPFEVSFDAMSRMNFSISLEASPSNCVEVSIGADANGDGVLSLDETDQTFGYNCGHWFQRDAVTSREDVVPAVASGRIDKTFVLKKRKLDESWDLVKVTRRGKGEVCELATVEGAKPGAALIVR